jgi:hypothetical protein
MQRSRLPVIVGVLLFLILGLVGLFFVIQSDGQGRKARENRQDEESASDKPRTRRTTDNGNRAPENTKPEKPVEPVLPKAQPVNGKISGIVVDSEESVLSGVAVVLLTEKGDTTTGPGATTNDKGEFAFEATLDSGEPYFVACLREDYAVAATDAFKLTLEKPEVSGLKLKLFHPARVHGIVISGDDSKPLEGVAIVLSAPRMSAREDRLARLLGRFKQVSSDVQGKYEVGQIPPGSYTVKAVKRGWISNEFNPLTRDSQTTELGEYANVELLPFILIQAGIVEGRVLRKSDKSPVVGANVELTTVLGGTFGSQVTDAEGKYRFENAPPSIMGGRNAGRGVPGGGNGPAGVGGIQVRALAESFAVASVSVTPEGGKTVQAPDLLLDDGCTVSGRVVDEKQNGIAGASVYFNDNQFLQGGEMVIGLALPPRAVGTTTESDGTFTLKHIPASGEKKTPRVVCARAQGFSNGETPVQMAPGVPTENVIITLMPAGTIAGKIVDENDEPVAGVPVAAYEGEGPQQLGQIMNAFFGEELPDRGSNSIVPPAIHSKEDGTYRIEGLKPKKYVVLANARQYEKHVSKAMEVKAGEVIEYNIKLVAGGVVFGRVYDSQEKPISGAAITAALQLMGSDSQDILIRTAYSDSNGAYEISGLKGGTYTVKRFDTDFTSFFIPNPASTVAVKRGERTRFDIFDQRPGTARIHGRVRVDGQPYVNKGLVMYGQGRRGTAVNQTTTDELGNYEFRSVPLGTYQIAQKLDGIPLPFPNLVRKTIRVEKAEDIEFNIDYVTVTVSGTVTLDGGDIPDGQVRVWVNPVNAQNEDGSPAATDQQLSPIEEVVATRADCDPKTGAFEIKGLSPGAYKLTVRSDKHGMLTKPYLNVQASVTGLQLVLPRESATLHGIAQGLENAKPGFPPNTILGVITLEDSKGAALTLGENGIVNLFEKKEFDIKNLPPGTYSVILSITNYAPTRVNGVVLEAGRASNVEFNVISSGSAKIKVTNAEFKIDEAYQLTYEIRDSKGAIYKKPFTFLDFFNTDGSTAQSADENAFTIKDLPQDTYTITFKHPEYDDCAATFTVITGQTVDVPVTFKKK